MEINHQKVNTIKKIGEVNISELELKIKTLTESDWDTKEDFELNYNKKITTNSKKNIAALGTTNHIILKFTNKSGDPFQYIIGSRWEQWKELLVPIMDAATMDLNYQNKYYPKVMLAKLPSKNFIKPHIDGNLKGVVPHKIHIAITTNPDTFFFLENNKFHFEKGMAYEVNNGKSHGVVNNGDTDRIHLIFECLDFDAQTDEIKKQIENPVIYKV